MHYMRPQEIYNLEPDSLPAHGVTALDHAQRAMRNTGCWTAGQQMGRRWPIGCVALEITQRCNLDCTLCYLSEHSESVKDIPLAEVFRRIELIRRHYGANTDVQITGGDPTLRRRDELIAIVRRVREVGLRPTLMTNGRKATRSLLQELASAGLFDVAFHVDTTQNLKGYRNEAELNRLRVAYLDRVRGLPISVMFNTTVHDGNFEDTPELVRFFAAHAGRIRTASFQVQAATGRGVHDKKRAITLDMVTAQICAGAEIEINFRSSLVGHSQCNRYGLCLAVNGRLHDALDDPAFIARLQAATARLVLDRVHPCRTVKDFVRWLGSHPRYLSAVLGWAANKAWQMKGDLLAARGRVNTISFLVHGFMDACALDRERIDACVFKTMTADGPISMCLHNAQRDTFILRPIEIHTPAGRRLWQPLSGALSDEPATMLRPDSHQYGRKRAKGRARQRLLGEILKS